MTEHRMTEEVRRALLSRVPFHCDSTIEFTPGMFLEKKDKEFIIPFNFRPSFSVRVFNKSEADESRSIKDNDDDADHKVRELTRKSIMGWKRYYDAGTMRSIEYKKDPDGGVDKALFDTFPINLIVEIYLYVVGISGLKTMDLSGL